MMKISKQDIHKNDIIIYDIYDKIVAFVIVGIPSSVNGNVISAVAYDTRTFSCYNAVFTVGRIRQIMHADSND